ncbi:hypothetical protein GW17_00043012 [Ensete ventricosum]|nr:hypothetical protein GW17_00043012 [Ensete ventricosum]
MPSSTQPQSLVATSSAIAACRRYHYAYTGDDATNVSFQYRSNTDQCRPSLSLGCCFSSHYPHHCSFFPYLIHCFQHYSSHALLQLCHQRCPRFLFSTINDNSCRLTTIEKEITIRCGLKSSPNIRPGLDDTVGTRRETRRKLAEGIGGLSRVCRELTESDRELTRKASGVRWKKTKRLPGRSSNVVEKLIEVRRVLLDLLVTMVVIN